MKTSHRFGKQQGYFLILAVIFIMVIGAMGAIIAYLYANRAMMSVARLNGLNVFYMAESGLEIVARNLTTTQSLTCNTLTGDPLVTDAALLKGTFTATAIGGGLYSATSTLAGGITASSTSLTLTSTTGFAPVGRVRVDGEAIDYASISGSTLVGLNRGAAGTTANSHTAGALAAESVCLVSVAAGIPSIASPKYQRTEQLVVEILLGSSDVWVVGNRHGNEFGIARYGLPTPGVWNDYSYRDVSNRENLLAVSPSSILNAWAVGVENNTNFTMTQWNGTSWNTVLVAGACKSQDLRGVATISETEAWAVGLQYRPACVKNGNYRYTILKWNGSVWTLLTPGTVPAVPADGANNASLNAISMYAPPGASVATFGFAVGNSGTILEYNGVNWVSVASGTTDDILGVAVLSSMDAWSVTSNGKILRWNGSAWVNFSSPVSTSLAAISMVDMNRDGIADAGWAVGNTGVIVNFDGTSWVTQSSGVTDDLTGVAAISPSNAWAVGGKGTLLKWSGSSWLSQPSPTASVNGLGVVRGGGAGVAVGSLVGGWSQSSG